MKVEKLRFSHFRGAIQPVELTFDHKKPITLIFGENGSGKSTIADAIDFICNQKFGSLELRKSVRKQTHIVSANGRSADLSVEMVCNGETWRAYLGKHKPITTPDKAPKAFVLRRANITKVTEETDGERYQTLADFITVANVESCEAALRKVAANVNKEVENAIQQKLAAETTLQNFWIEEGRPNGNYMAWARQSSQQAMTALEAQIEADTRLQMRLEQLLTNDQNLRGAARQRNEAVDMLEKVRQELAIALHAQANAAAFNTLREARRYLQANPDSTVCPVCAKPEPHSTLLAQVEAALERLQTLLTLQEQLESRQKSLTAAEGVYDNHLGRWRKSYSELHPLLSSAPTSLMANIQVASVDTDIPTIRHTLAQLENRLPSLKARIELAEKQVSQHNALKTHLNTIDELAEATVEKQALAQRLQQMHQSVKEARQQHVLQVVDSISATVADLYNRIHPDEPLGNPNFNLNTRYAGSLTLSATFGNHQAPPGAYYSEAHLDTLGLCVYLALAKQSGNAIVVLDDVLTSVDGPHLRRIVDLINEEAPQFGHVIVTTHQRAWLNMVRYGKGMNADLIELYDWNMAHGIRHSRTPLAVESLRTAVSTPHLNRQHVASAAGVLLEQLLDTLTWRYACHLPRKNPPSYTLGELSGAISGKLLNSLRLEQIDGEGTIHELPLKSLIEACTQDSWIRNQVGAHFNADEATISDNDVRQFAKNTLSLADALQCDHCRQLPSNDKTGEYWSCGGHCKKLRLYPLQKPA